MLLSRQLHSNLLQLLACLGLALGGSQVFAATAINSPVAMIDAAISVSGETDSYSFSLAQGESVQISVVDPSHADTDDLAPYIRLFDPSNTEVRSGNDYVVARIFSYTAETGGTFEMHVSSGPNAGKDATGPYRLYFSKAPGASEHGSLNDHHMSSGTIDLGDIDSYSFSANAGDRAHLRMTATSGDLFPYLHLYDPDGEPISSVGDYAVAASRSVALEKTGQYTVMLSAGHPNGRQRTTGDYTLHFARAPGANEHGLLSDHDTRSGSIDLGDIDSYTFYAEENDRVHVRLADLAGQDMYPYIHLYSPSGELVEHAGGYTVADLQNQLLTETGVYTLILTSGHYNGLEDTAGSYTLHFARLPGANEGGDLGAFATILEQISRADIDTYTFVGTTGEKLNLVLTDLSGSDFFPSCFLYGPSGAYLAQDGDYTQETLNNYQLTESGVYTLLIAAGHPNGLTDTDGAYQLDFELTGRLISYAALGDSYSSGEGVLPFEGNFGEQWGIFDGCNRSWGAYPRLVATPDNSLPLSQRADALFDFYACTGAVTNNVRASGEGQYGEPPQAIASQVDAGRELITLSIGGNDAQFVRIVGYCLAHNHCNDLKPFDPHSDLTLGELFPAWVAVVKQRVIATYQEIRSKAPHAAIVVAGYPLLVSGNECPALEVPGYADAKLSAAEQTWMREANAQLNTALREAAAQVGVHFVPVAEHFDTHGICGTQEDWIFGTYHIWPQGLFHPNARGQKEYARLINSYLGSLNRAWPAGHFASGLPRNPAPTTLPAAASAIDALQLGAELPAFGELSVSLGNIGTGCEGTANAIVPAEAVILNGVGFGSGQNVDLTLLAGGQSYSLDSATADSNGVLDATVVIPAAVASGIGGVIEASAAGANEQGLKLLAMVQVRDDLTSDSDSDGIPDGCDNCVDTPNADQLDADFDGIGDACDGCASDPLNDADGDGSCGNVDMCPIDAGNDADGDGLCESDDNCPGLANAAQLNTDFDLLGDVCDLDDDNDDMPDSFEMANGFDPLDKNDAGLDSDVDGLINVAEYERGTDPRDNDSDSDGYLDGDDIDPLDRMNPIPTEALPSRGGWRAILR